MIRSPGGSLMAACLFIATMCFAAQPAGVGGSPDPDDSIPRAVFPDGHRFKLEIARTPEEQARGYMFRSYVGPEEGMLFPFPESGLHSFWMKNCKVSLDILWLSEDLDLVHLEEKVPPCRKDPCPSYSSMRKARYVLEIRAGMALKAGLHLGDRIRIEGVELAGGAAHP